VLLEEEDEDVVEILELLLELEVEVLEVIVELLEVTVMGGGV